MHFAGAPPPTSAPSVMALTKNSSQSGSRIDLQIRAHAHRTVHNRHFKRATGAVIDIIFREPQLRGATFRSPR